MTEASSSENLLRLQSEILEAVARGEKLVTIAQRICLRAEQLAPEAICTILTSEPCPQCQVFIATVSIVARSASGWH